eukprot:gene9212-biopygen7615
MGSKRGRTGGYTIRTRAGNIQGNPWGVALSLLDDDVVLGVEEPVMELRARGPRFLLRKRLILHIPNRPLPYPLRSTPPLSPPQAHQRRLHADRVPLHQQRHVPLQRLVFGAPNSWVPQESDPFLGLGDEDTQEWIPASNINGIGWKSLDCTRRFHTSPDSCPQEPTQFVGRFSGTPPTHPETQECDSWALPKHKPIRKPCPLLAAPRPAQARLLRVDPRRGGGRDADAEQHARGAVRKKKPGEKERSGKRRSRGEGEVSKNWRRPRNPSKSSSQFAT